MAIKLKYNPTKFTNNRERINDIGIRVLLIPFFGIAIPIVTGMVPHEKFTNLQVKLSYLFTILIAFVIYEGSRFLHFTLRSYFDWLDRPGKKILAILITIPFYCVPVSMLLLVAWYHIFLEGNIDWKAVKLSALLITIAVFFLVNIYETVFAVRDMAADRINKEQLERARAEAELEALKNQIDPHFIFNSLNTLSHLIEEHPAKAKEFNDSLADVYRYILQNKARDLVLLQEEITFLQHYFSLVKIRFEKAVIMNLVIDDRFTDQYLIPPISLQLLVENAIKHNEFSDDMPLQIGIIFEDDTLVVSNILHKKILRKPSSQIGLRNLSERYKLITDKQLVVKQEENNFVVYLPVLKID
ncbi:MAG: sensor histidine kinase [Ferruginibacter sp.]